ncbi:hypothetical protein [Novosphingobium mathurense]|uniref:Uncharacterized protein n=1 Tax=Novosphingobium mathurense TaxID=428990 RepID=A0A1U6I7H7_9SPHN|nr:hypothetical protein [Novosphingobium mathurense]SLK03951.1 hypothetical protein SAMN06295987_104312 [Novosphingobium mathurense]
MDNWQPGDLALCVRNGFKMCRTGPIAPDALQIPVGSVQIVSGVFEAIDEVYRAEGVLFLKFRGSASTKQYDCRGFRKIHPLTDEERESFLADLPEPVEG